MYKFVERTVAPTQSNAEDKIYYFSDTNNVYYYAGYGMPNCTCYSLGRVNQLSALNNTKYPDVDGFAGNGETWGQSGYIGQNWVKSDKPKLGAIAVWRGGSASGDGHVAPVEAIYADGTIKTSNSGWHGSANVGNEDDSRWWWIEDHLDYRNYGTYEFMYFLYPNYIDEEPTPPEPPEPPEPPKDKKSWIPLAICNAMLNNI